MKILLDIHPASFEKSGIGRYCDNLTRALLRDKRVRLSFYSNLPKSRLPLFYQGRVFEFGIKHGLVRTLVGLNIAVEKLKPEILHATTLTPYKKKVPTVLTLHDLCFVFRKKDYGIKTRLAFRLFLKRSLKNADQIIVPSGAVYEKLSELFPEVLYKTSVIYEAASFQFSFVKDKKGIKAILSRRFGIERPFFLVVGNVEKRKRPKEIIKAFKRLLRENQNATLVFAGSDKLRGEVRKDNRRLIKEKKLLMLGYVNDKDLNILYNGALATVFFSSCEGFGLPLLESMRCKTPVICSDIKVFREIARNAAIYSKNVIELTLGMKKLISDRDLKEKLVELGVRRNRDFSWAKAAKETIAVYQKVLSAKIK